MTMRIGGMILVMVAAVAVSLFVGAADVSFAEFLNALRASERTPEQVLAHTIFTEIRIPRLVLAVLCGAALAGAGVVSQGLFRNTLASPSIIGTTSGAAFFAVIVFYVFGNWVSWLMLPTAAFVGAMLATFTVLGLATLYRNMTIGHLLLVGFAINTLFGAATSLVISLMLEDHERTSAAMHWMLGGFIARSWDDVALTLLPLILGSIVAWQVCRYLDVLSLGEETAQTLAIPIQRVRLLGMVAMALLVASVVAVAGAIGFVGLVVPHITRLMIGPQHRRLFLVAAVNGVTLMLVADLLARTIRSPLEMEVGVLTALIGAPFFVFLLVRKSGGMTL